MVRILLTKFIPNFPNKFSTALPYIFGSVHMQPTNFSNIFIGNAVRIKTIFLGCSNLKTIDVPSSVTEIGESAFAGCTELETIRYFGTEKNWNDITIAQGNENLIHATVVFCIDLDNPETYMLGDVNYDKQITAADARLVLRKAAKLEMMPIPTQIADVNKDGIITAADARKILRVAASLET